jgi:hypothetical protein
MRGDVIVDLRNIYYKERKKMADFGFKYVGVGFKL